MPDVMSPLVDVVPLQLFAMDMAEIKGYDVDKRAISPDPSRLSDAMAKDER